MARRRTRPGSNANSEAPTQQERQVRTMAGLTAEQVQALLGKARQKGEYQDLMNAFIESGELGVSVSETWPHLGERNGQTVAQGFKGVKDKKGTHEDAQYVRVLTQSEGEGDDKVTSVFLINMKLAAEQAGVPVEAS